MSKKVTKYWIKHYATEHCTLCGNRGVIDTRGVRTPAGVAVGRLNYCICPNGQALRDGGGDLEENLQDVPLPYYAEYKRGRIVP